MEREKDPPAPAVGAVSLGDLRRITAISDYWGVDRGNPVDRRYIAEFLARHAADIKGHVLEVKDPGYSRHFGGDRISRIDVVDIDTANQNATLIADLENAPQIADNTYDCIVLTQVLPVIFDVFGAVATLYRVLKPGGVLLMTVPGPFSPCFKGDDHERFFWAFYPDTVRKLLGKWFAPQAMHIEAKGNLTTCSAFIAGLAQQDLGPEDYEGDVDCYPLIISARAVK